MAYDRLRELHSFVRSTLDDGQIRDDTRLAFAINRLSTAWLADETTEAATNMIDEIRISAFECVRKAPWKFQMWRAVVRCAIRRAPELDTESEEWRNSQMAAEKWLDQMLRMISIDPKSTRSWLKVWPEYCNNSHVRTENWKQGYVSFIRTSFWSSMCSVIRDLRNMDIFLSSESTNAATLSSQWNSKSWIFRCLSENQIVSSLEWISDLDKWLQILYGADYEHVDNLPFHEKTEIEKAILACTPRDQLMLDLVKNDTYTFDNQTPFSNSKLRLPHKLLEKFSISNTDSNLIGTKVSAWPLLLLSAKQVSLQDEPFAKQLKAVNKLNQTQTLLISNIFGLDQVAIEELFASAEVVDDGDKEKAQTIILTGHTLTQRAAALYSYALQREYLVEKPPERTVNALKSVSIHRIIWGIGNYDLRLALTRPSEAPALGLPISVAVAFFEKIVNDTAKPMIKEELVDQAPHPSNWLVMDNALDLLSAGRKIQRDESITSAYSMSNTEITNFVSETIDPDDWDINPHPAYFLPWALGLVTCRSYKYRMWCHFLTFLTVLEGSERLLDCFMDGGGPGLIAFEERWDMRSRIHLPTEMWEELTKLQKWFSDNSEWSDEADLSLTDENQSQQLELVNLKKLSTVTALKQYPITMADFEWQLCIPVKVAIGSGRKVANKIGPIYGAIGTK